jgi:hypothetical protein
MGVHPVDPELNLLALDRPVSSGRHELVGHVFPRADTDEDDTPRACSTAATTPWGTRLYLIRPDGHVGDLGAPATSSRFWRYLERVPLPTATPRRTRRA